MKRQHIIAAMMAVAMPIVAQDEVETTVEADVVSQYVWRGQDLGNASLQPSLGISYRGLSLGAWGSVGIADAQDTKEMDLTLSYTTGGLTIGVTDYWFNSGLDARNRYFKYDAHATNHVFEANIGYDFGVASIQWYTNFAGNDGANKDGKRAYSSYAELSLPFRLASVDWQAAVGVVPWATDFYGVGGFAVTHVAVRASRNVRVTDCFSLPVFAEVSANPAAEKAYLAFGVTLRP